MQSKNITEICNALKKEYTRFYSFGGSFNPVSPERLRSRVFPAPGNPLASSPNDWCQNGGNPRVKSKYLPLVDDYFPKRPAELEECSLYNFAKLYDIVKTKPVNPDVEYHELMKNKFIRRRKRDCLVNHYKYNQGVESRNK